MDIEAIKKDHRIYQKVLRLRYELFFKEHNLPFEVLQDEKEDTSDHIAAFTADDLIAYGRLSYLDQDKFQISQMVVSPHYQGKGYGSKVLVRLIQLAKSRGANSIFLNARISATALYAKHGFSPIGAVFNSKITDVPHIQMVYHIRS